MDLASFVTIRKSNHTFNLLHLPNNCSDTSFRKCVSERNEKSTQIASNEIEAVCRLCSRPICHISLKIALLNILDTDDVTEENKLFDCDDTFAYNTDEYFSCNIN